MPGIGPVYSSYVHSSRQEDKLSVFCPRHHNEKQWLSCHIYKFADSLYPKAFASYNGSKQPSPS